MCCDQAAWLLKTVTNVGPLASSTRAINDASKLSSRSTESNCLQRVYAVMNIAQSYGFSFRGSGWIYVPRVDWSRKFGAFASICWIKICLRISRKVGFAMSMSASELAITARVWSLNSLACLIVCFNSFSMQSKLINWKWAKARSEFAMSTSFNFYTSAAKIVSANTWSDYSCLKSRAYRFQRLRHAVYVSNLGSLSS